MVRELIEAFRVSPRRPFPERRNAEGLADNGPFPTEDAEDTEGKQKRLDVKMGARK